MFPQDFTTENEFFCKLLRDIFPFNLHIDLQLSHPVHAMVSFPISAVSHIIKSVECDSISECTKNKALDKGKENKKASAAPGPHFARKDFKYVTPVLKKDVMTDQV